MSSNLSKYHFTERPRGFVVEADQRLPVCVTLGTTGFYIEQAGERQLRLFPELPDVGLVAYRELTERIVRLLMARWSPPEGKNTDWGGVYPWVLSNTKRAIGARVHAEWKRLLAKASPRIVASQKAAFAASFKHVPLMLADEIYRDKFLVNDVVNHRAAALTMAVAMELLEQEADDGAPLGLTDAKLERLHDWQGLLSPTRQKYRSLSRTLMSLPGGIPSGLFTYITQIYLDRPITDRVTLLALLMAVEYCSVDDEIGDARDLFMRAKREEIVAGMQLVNETLLRKLSTRRARDIGFFVRYLLDYPGDRPRRLASLVNQSIKWHRHINRWCEEDYSLSQVPTMKPPIPLPEDPSISFLSTTGAIYREALELDHCVYRFARGAVEGRRFFFSVDRAGERATVEVNQSGEVVQASGPRNSENLACRYGSRVLGTWGRGFQHFQNKSKSFTGV